MRLPDLPEEIIEKILSYAPDYHPNLLKCHTEILKNRPCYYKKVVAGFKPGIGNHPTWQNFTKKNNHELKFVAPWLPNLKLYAMEITPVKIFHIKFRKNFCRDILCPWQFTSLITSAASIRVITEHTGIATATILIFINTHESKIIAITFIYKIFIEVI